MPGGGRRRPAQNGEGHNERRLGLLRVVDVAVQMGDGAVSQTVGPARVAGFSEEVRPPGQQDAARRAVATVGGGVGEVVRVEAGVTCRA